MGNQRSIDDILDMNGSELAALFNVENVSLYVPGVWTTRRSVWEPEHPKGEDATQREHAAYGRRHRKVQDIPYRHDSNVELYGSGNQMEAHEKLSSALTLREITTEIDVPLPVPPTNLTRSRRKAYWQKIMDGRKHLQNTWMVYAPQPELPRILAPVVAGNIVNPNEIALHMRHFVHYTTPLPQILFLQAEYRKDAPFMQALGRAAA